MENTKIKVFKNLEFGSVRTVEINNKPYFVGKDVAEILGYRETANMRKLIEKEDCVEIDPQKSDFTGFVQNGTTLESNPNVRRMLIINESGLYTAIFNSTLPNAKKFKRWVTSEVLPSIRKNGAYADTNENVIGLVTITPTVAQTLLERNFNNRPISQIRVKGLVQDMLMGKWELNGETIKIYDDGTLADGQHRLTACIQSGVPFKTYIIKNLHKEVLSTIDCGEKRSLAAGLNMKGVSIDAKLIPSFNYLFNKGSKLTSPQVEYLFTKFNKECTFITSLLPRGSSDFRSYRTFRAFSLYLLIIKHYPMEKVKDFVEGMKDKPNCTTNFETTSYYYRRWYEKNIKYGKSNGGLTSGNVYVREFTGLLQCLDSFENDKVITRFSSKGKALSELDKCVMIAQRAFKELEEKNKLTFVDTKI